MIRKSTIIAIIVVALLLIASYFVKPKFPLQTENPEISVVETREIGGVIRLITPVSEEITMPAVISGEAPGTWFFEAQFPVDVIDSSGAVIASGLATADGEWMTENYAPFTLVIKGAVAERAEGRIIFRKSNPSGLEENDAQVSLPIFINPSVVTPEEVTDISTLKIYFGIQGEDDCSKVQYIERTVPKTAEVAKAALTELLRGPVEDPKLITSINPDTKLNSVIIRNGTAYADFNSGLNKDIGGSCRVTAIRAQITETLKQFPTIKNVVISVNGETEAILEP